MVLKFHGGVHINAKKLFADSEIKYIDNCWAICIAAGEEYSLVAEIGAQVYGGELLGFSDGTPVYASVSGCFNGVLEIEGSLYFTVISDGENNQTPPYEPEQRALTQLTKEDIIFAARQFAVMDSRSGMPLWKLLSQTENCRRVVIDCTEPFPNSALLEQVCLENARQLVYGSKILLQATGALKCVFALECGKKKVINAIGGYAHDEKLFAAAPLEEKYPYTDRALVYALYVKNLDMNETPAENGILIVSAEAAIALFNAMVSGMPQTRRFVTLCGDGFENGGNFSVPRGITFHDLQVICNGFPQDKLIVKNSLLSGQQVAGALDDSTIAILAAEDKKIPQKPCISCGECANVCPVKLFPAEILLGKSQRMYEKCVACGACEYVCPSAIPLMNLIKTKEGDSNE